MHLAADAVADVFADDTDVVRMGLGLHGGADVPQALAGPCLLDALPQCSLGHLQQEVDLIGQTYTGH